MRIFLFYPIIFSLEVELASPHHVTNRINKGQVFSSPFSSYLKKEMAWNNHNEMVNSLYSGVN